MSPVSNAEKPIDVSIVIVNWKVKDLLRQCLSSIGGATHDLLLEVIVVDNNSGDGSSEMIRQEFPDVRLIANTENAGFARANNQGIAISRGRYILLLNPDTIVIGKSIPAMAAFLDGNREAGAVGPKIRFPDGTIQYTCARNLPSLLTGFLDLSGLSYKFPKGRVTGSWQMGYWDHNDERDVDAISGACMMVKREVIDRIGLLDEKYFMYGEDIDWCFRIKRGGWKIRYLPTAEITHFAGQSSRLYANIVMEDYRSMYRFLKSKDGSFVAVLYRLLAIVLGGLWFLYWSTRLAIAGSDPKGETIRKEVLPRYRTMIGWGLGTS
jgi:GT2 family glycosyltransferase